MAKVFALILATFLFSAVLAVPIEGDDEKKLQDIADDIKKVTDGILKYIEDGAPSQEELAKHAAAFKSGMSSFVSDIAKRFGLDEADLQKLNEDSENFEKVITSSTQAKAEELKPAFEEAIKKMKSDMAKLHSDLTPIVDKSGKDVKDVVSQLYQQWLAKTTEVLDDIKQKIEGEQH